MDPRDDQLEIQLQRLENGEPLEQVAASLGPEQAELAALLQTAARARFAQHPQMDPLKARALQAQVRAASRGRVTVKRSPRLTRVLIPIGVMSLAAFAFLVVLAGVLIFGSPSSAHAATLSGVQGVVEVSQSADAADWTVASEGQKVRQGMHIRSRLESGATLVFFDGSRAAIGPDAEVVVEQLSGGWDRALKLRLRQVAGETSHQVVKLRFMRC
jgi:hypothetical protein